MIFVYVKRVNDQYDLDLCIMHYAKWCDLKKSFEIFFYLRRASYSIEFASNC